MQLEDNENIALHIATTCSGSSQPCKAVGEVRSGLGIQPRRCNPAARWRTHPKAQGWSWSSRVRPRNSASFSAAERGHRPHGSKILAQSGSARVQQTYNGPDAAMASNANLDDDFLKRQRISCGTDAFGVFPKVDTHVYDAA
jgi:hypothetical protein